MVGAGVYEYVSHWGNAVLLLPAALGIAVGLVLGGVPTAARRWSTWFGAVVLVTFATKVAFLGWGIGWRSLDFTGISGHALLASAVFTMLAAWLTHERGRSARRWMIASAVMLALMVAATRLALGLHSLSEVAIGLLLGFAVARVSMVRPLARPEPRRWRAIVATSLLVACALPIEPGEEAHSLTSRIALALSGHDRVFTREML